MRAYALVAVSLLLMPPFVWAVSGPATSPHAIPFDDVDQTVAQAEVTQQIATFLQMVRTHWGESQDVIRGRVTGTMEREDPGALVFARSVADHEVLEGYEFQEGSLVRGQYIVLQRPVNGLNEFIDYYAAVKQSLIAVYGTPAQDQTIWDNDLYQPLPDYWGVAVQIGHLRYAATWEMPEGTITIQLTGNHHSRLMIEYRNRALVDHPQTA